MFLIILLCISKQVLSISDADFHNNFDVYFRRQFPKYINDVTFPPLQNYEVNATAVSETKYKWIGRLILSRSNDIPHICTTVCIDPAIFITSARCLHGLKVKYTSILYNKQQLPAVAFVLPSHKSKQAFDDIGLIVVDSKDTWKDKSKWHVVELLNPANRTDDDYGWFIKMDHRPKVKAIGYSAKKGFHRLVTIKLQYNLTELDVFPDSDICHNMLKPDNVPKVIVPCYFPCTFAQFKEKNKLCSRYHGVEGGAVFDTTSNKLMGIATWGIYHIEVELPVGFSFPNSNKFFNDYACAKKIRAANKPQVSEGYYQKLCH